MRECFLFYIFIEPQHRTELQWPLLFVTRGAVCGPRLTTPDKAEIKRQGNDSEGQEKPAPSVVIW